MVEGTRIVRKELGNGVARRAEITCRPPNPLREALTTGRFCYMVEMVASASMRGGEAVRDRLGTCPDSRSGGRGHHQLRGRSRRARSHPRRPPALASRAESQRPPDVRESRSGRKSRKALEDLISLGIENVFAITGDYPKGAPLGNASVRLRFGAVGGNHRRAARGRAWPFYISVAVSPFKYTEADCAYQYLKLEKEDRRRRRLRHHAAGL